MGHHVLVPWLVGWKVKDDGKRSGIRRLGRVSYAGPGPYHPPGPAIRRSPTLFLSLTRR